MPINKTPEEITEFLAQGDIEYNSVNTKQSFKTNILILARNFVSNAVFSNKLLSFVKFLYQKIDVQNLILGVLDMLERKKLKILIEFDLVIGSFVIQEIDERIFKIQRIDKYNIEITEVSNPEWDVDSLLIQVKQLDGTFVYPTIKTTTNKINCYFLDEITTNYNIFII